MNSVAARSPAEKPPRYSKAPKVIQKPPQQFKSRHSDSEAATVIQKPPERFKSDHSVLVVCPESQVLLGIPTNLVAMTRRNI
jgi:hypothetical protein